MLRCFVASTKAVLNAIYKNDRNNRLLVSTKALATKATNVQTIPVHRGQIVDGLRDYRVVDEILGLVNRQIVEDSHSRLFAVVFINGKQFKVTAEDMISLQCHLPLELGETIVLEKVMLVGGTDFTIIGRPLIDKNVVRVLATVVEKTLNFEYRRFFHVKRTRLHRSYFFRDPYMVLRINGVQLLKNIEA
ncbi:39S ribosomal protein L21 [Tropilaelaps mercedesae]|uniref:Large ribosomal subunit protein bL21m n=1 Tax=Tropilaelaps mercedesae TaxID=418985 RepID=A0A1V9XEN0_9ACAR|nr:39S ribosomal protein L21 [Tropilaelaps mercedesae]